jgi:apolipoprotein N-acyltransferase
MMGPLINIKEASAQMGIDFQTLQMALKKRLYPFGEAIPCKNRYRYVIVRARFEAYMAAQDMKPGQAQ